MEHDYILTIVTKHVFKQIVRKKQKRSKIFLVFNGYRNTLNDLINCQNNDSNAKILVNLKKIVEPTNDILIFKKEQKMLYNKKYLLKNLL